MAFAALFMTQCSKQHEPMANEPSGETMEVTVRVDNSAAKTEITAAGAVTWKQGDKLYVVGETQGLLGYVSAKADGDPATFEGNITALTSAQKLRFYYVGDKAFTLDGSGNYTFDLSAQDGTLEGIAAHNQLMHGQTTGTVAVGQTNFGQISMTSLMAIAHFKITADGVATSTFSISGGFATSTFNAKTCNGTITGTGTGNIAVTLTSPAVSTDCYVALLPGAQALTFSNAGKEASLSEKTVVANQFYNSESPIEVEMTEVLYVKGEFSVASGKKVRFAKGNLQFQASSGTWRFAPNQWDIIGNAPGNTTSSPARNTQSEWVDLFGWGDLTGLNISSNSSNYPWTEDWGTKIGSGWRTLELTDATSGEWYYLIKERPSAKDLRGEATVNDVPGLIVLPDNWVKPGDVSFTAGSNYSSNNYNSTQWAKMEAAGAVFLPSAGRREGISVSDLTIGRYWSKNNRDAGLSYFFHFQDSYIFPSDINPYYTKNSGLSVRLVLDVN